MEKIDLNNKTILVTGHAGFIGSNLAVGSGDGSLIHTMKNVRGQLLVKGSWLFTVQD